MCYLNWFWNSPLCRGSFHPETIPAGAAGETVLTTYRKAAEQSNTCHHITVSRRHREDFHRSWQQELFNLWVKTRYMTDSNKRFLCRRKNRRRARCSHHMRLETEPKETKFVTYRNKSVGCWRCFVDMCVFVFCIPTGYITLNWQWQNLKYQNTVD